MMLARCLAVFGTGVLGDLAAHAGVNSWTRAGLGNQPNAEAARAWFQTHHAVRSDGVRQVVRVVLHSWRYVCAVGVALLVTVPAIAGTNV